MKFTPRGIVFVLIFLAVAYPLLFPLNISDRISPETERFKNLIDSLPAGCVVMVSFDHEASTIAEVRPLSTVLISHLFSRNIKVIGLSLFAEGTAIGNQVLTANAKEFGREYGRDWVFLGFRPQYQSAILGLGDSIVNVFPRDYYRHPTSELPLLAEVPNYSKISLVVSVADGDLANYWVEYAHSRFGVRVAGMVTAVMATSLMPYYASGQLSGLVNGLKGAAEYERLTNRPGAAVRGMDAQSLAHLVIFGLILAGNFAYWLGRRK
jgi:hypothetical protein